MTGSLNCSHGDNLDPDDPERVSVAPPTRPANGSLFSGLGELGLAAATLTGVDGAAIAMVTGSTGIRDLVHATDPMAYHLDELQFTLGEGPCLDVFTPGGSPQLIPDLSDAAVADRWPVFVAEARLGRVKAMFAYAITARDRPLGVLELYRRTTGDLTAAEHDAATRCAEAVASTMSRNWDAVVAGLGPGGDRATKVAEWLATDELMEQGVNSRAQVYLASGMIAVQLRIPTDEAMSVLRAHAYQSGRSIKDVADDVVARRLDLRGEVDGSPTVP